MADRWAREPVSAISRSASAPRYQPKQAPSFEEQLGEAGVAKIVTLFLNGKATQQELADRHGTSLSTIKRLLRKREARLWAMEQKRGRLRTALPAETSRAAGCAARCRRRAGLDRPFHAGTTKQQLAEACDTSVSNVRRVIASEGAQLWRRGKSEEGH